MARKQCDLKKKLRVTFVGEAGLDLGGLTKEWFLLLVRQIFHTDYGETPPRLLMLTNAASDPSQYQLIVPKRPTTRAVGEGYKDVGRAVSSGGDGSCSDPSGSQILRCPVFTFQVCSVT